MNESGKSLESWIWDAACSIRGAKDAAKYKEFILPLIFTKGLCGAFAEDAVFVKDGGPFYGREAIEKFHVDLFKEWRLATNSSNQLRIPTAL
jgi:type I restriction-modification system DNA methylase subunit